MTTSRDKTQPSASSSVFSYQRQINIGLITLAATVLFFSYWSFVAPLESGAVAPGKIVVDNNRKTIQHLDGGIIENINVKDGDVVQQGDILITLDQTEVTMERNRLYAEWLSLLATNARLNTEYTEGQKINFPEIFFAEEFKERKAEYIQIQRNLMDSRQQTQKNEISIYQQKKAQLSEQISGLNKQARAGEKRLALLQEEINDLQTLKKKEYIAKTILLERSREHAEVLAEIAQLKSSSAGLQIKIGETGLEVLQIQKEFKQDVSNSIGKTRAEIFDAEDRLRSIDKRLKRTSITAPSNGVVFNSQIHTLGGIIPAGATIMEIVPNQARLLVEAEASPLDIESIHTGDSANIRFSSLSSRTTPLLKGTVEFVAADSHENNARKDVYIVRVLIGKQELEKLDGIGLLPGMPVEVLILKGERTLISYLTKPLTTALFRGLKED